MLSIPINRRVLVITVLVAFTSLFFLVALAFHPTLLSGLTPLSPAQSDPRYVDGPITYIPFTFGWAMLLQTLRGYQAAGWPNIIVVDNSWDAHAYEVKGMLREAFGVLDVIATPVHLRFAQIQAFMDRIARDSGAKTYFWSHTDVLLLPSTRDAFQQATECVLRAGDNLGVLFFFYDLLSAVTINAGKVAPWDPAMPQYGSDCDRYKRLRLAGMEVRDCEVRIGEILHLHSVLTEEELARALDDRELLEDRVAFVNGIDQSREKYTWREGGGDTTDAITEMDTQAAEAEGEGGRRYHFAKWGNDPTCELDGRTPAFDVPGLGGWETTRDPFESRS